MVRMSHYLMDDRGKTVTEVYKKMRFFCDCVAARGMLHREVTDLDVRVHIHKRPLAVVTTDAKGHLYLFVQQDTHFDSLFLQKKAI